MKWSIDCSAAMTGIGENVAISSPLGPRIQADRKPTPAIVGIPEAAGGRWGNPRRGVSMVQQKPFVGMITRGEFSYSEP